MTSIEFVIAGSGWRAEFYIRIARALPERFKLTGMLVRDEIKGKELERKWGVPTFRTLDGLLKGAACRFAVVSVARTAAPAMIAELARRGVPALAETPPAADLATLSELWRTLPKDARVQVAEQYAWQPMHAARIALARSGKLGEITHAQVSAGHDYHGVSLIRKLLGTGFRNAVIRGSRFTGTIVKGPGREGVPAEEELVPSTQDIVTLEFEDGKSAVYDFSREQYFSWIRRSRMLIRGSRGEIVDTSYSYLADFRTPVYGELRRVDAGHDGNLEGYYNRGVLAGEQWAYTNPFAPARLSDEELAIAGALELMGGYADGGAPFYSLAEAAQDQYLGLLMGQAVETGGIVKSERQPWAED